MSQKISAIIADDDHDTVSIFVDYLKIKKIEVLGWGYDGREAVSLFEELKPDFVFVDHNMPKFDGIYALKNIRKINPQAKVIIISSDKTIETNQELMALKPTAILYKPFQIKKIIETININLPPKIPRLHEN